MPTPSPVWVGVESSLSPTEHPPRAKADQYWGISEERDGWNICSSVVILNSCWHLVRYGPPHFEPLLAIHRGLSPCLKIWSFLCLLGHMGIIFLFSMQCCALRSCLKATCPTYATYPPPLSLLVRIKTRTAQGTLSSSQALPRKLSADTLPPDCSQTYLDTLSIPLPILPRTHPWESQDPPKGTASALIATAVPLGLLL